MRAYARAATVFTRGALTPVLADTSATTAFTLVALASMRAYARAATLFTLGAFTTMLANTTLTFDFGTRVALQTRFEHFAESIHLEAVSVEALAASGTLDGIVHAPVLDCIHMH